MAELWPARDYFCWSFWAWACWWWPLDDERARAPERSDVPRANRDISKSVAHGAELGRDEIPGNLQPSLRDSLCKPRVLKYPLGTPLERPYLLGGSCGLGRGGMCGLDARQHRTCSTASLDQDGEPNRGEHEYDGRPSGDLGQQVGSSAGAERSL